MRVLAAVFVTFCAFAHAETPGRQWNQLQNIFNPVPAILTLPLRVQDQNRKKEPELLTLSDLARLLSEDPKARQGLIDSVSKIMALDAKTRHALEQAVIKLDKSFLDRFPAMTPAQLLQAAEAYAKSQKPAPEPEIPAFHTLTLSGQPQNPAPGEFLKDLGFGLKYGDEELINQGSSYGDNMELARILNWLTLNDEEKPAFELIYGLKKFTSLDSFLQALLNQGDSLEIRDMRFFANFGDLWYDHNGRRKQVITPVYADTGVTLPSGKKLLVPVTHSHLEITLRGKINADLLFFLGIDGEAKFRPKATANQSWVGGRQIERLEGEKAVTLLKHAGAVRKELLAKARENKLPMGGYGPLGSCNDIHAFVTGKAPYPMMRDPKYFKGNGLLDKLSSQLPVDAAGAADAKRILNSLPFENPADIPIAHVREALTELKDLSR